MRAATAISDLRFVSGVSRGGDGSSKMIKMMIRLLLCISVVVTIMVVDCADTASFRLKKRKLYMASKTSSSTKERQSFVHNHSSLKQILEKRRQERMSRSQVSNHIINKDNISRRRKDLEEEVEENVVEEEDDEEEQQQQQQEQQNDGTISEQVKNENEEETTDDKEADNNNDNKKDEDSDKDDKEVDNQEEVKEEEDKVVDNTDLKESAENNSDGTAGNNKQEKEEAEDVSRTEDTKEDEDGQDEINQDDEEEVTTTKDDGEESSPKNDKQKEEDVSGGSDSASNNDVGGVGDNGKEEVIKENDEGEENNTGKVVEDSDGEENDDGDDVVSSPTNQPTLSPNVEDESAEELPTPSPIDALEDGEFLPTPSPNIEDEIILPTPAPNSDDIPTSNPIILDVVSITNLPTSSPGIITIDKIPTPLPTSSIMMITDVPNEFRIPVVDPDMTSKPTAFLTDKNSPKPSTSPPTGIRPPSSSYYVTCHLCDGDPTATIKYPNKVISYEYYGVILYDSCRTMKRDLKEGLYTETQCNAITSINNIFTTCGCTTGGSGDDDYLWDDDNTNDVCYVCGDPYAFPQLYSPLVDVSYLNIGLDEAPCGTVERLGYNGILTSKQCDQVSSNENFYNECGCSNPGNSTESTVICYMCDGNKTATLEFPQSNVNLSFIGFPNDFATCADVKAAGEDGVLFKSECDALKADKVISKTCGCTPGPVSSPVQKPVQAPSVSQPPIEKQPVMSPSIPGTDDSYNDDVFEPFTCYACIGDPNYVVTYPDVFIDVSSLDLPFDSAPCSLILIGGLSGLLTQEQCSSIQYDSDIDFFNDCGCSKPDNSTESTVICYMCDGDVTAIIEFPQSSVNLSFIGFPNDFATCADVKAAGEDGVLFKSECVALKADKVISKTCGCTPGPVSSPVRKPIQAPSVSQPPIEKQPVMSPSIPGTDDSYNDDVFEPFTCYACIGDPNYVVTNPDAVVDVSSLLGLPVSSAPCSLIVSVGLTGLLTQEQCSSIQYDSDIDFFKICGCSNPINSTDSTNLCYMCDGDVTATIEFPQNNVSLSFIGLPDNYALCADVKAAGDDGFLFKWECDALKADAEISKTCGCTPGPISSPVRKPIQAPSVFQPPIEKNPVKSPSMIQLPIRRPSTIIRPTPIPNQPVTQKPIPDNPFFDLVKKPRLRPTLMPIVKKPIATKPIPSQPTMVITPSAEPSDMPSDVPTMMDTMSDT